jgi:hypothetical protein
MPGRHTITLDGSVDLIDDRVGEAVLPVRVHGVERAREELVRHLRRRTHHGNPARVEQAQLGDRDGQRPRRDADRRRAAERRAVSRSRASASAASRSCAATGLRCFQFPAVSGETYQSRKDLRQSANEEFGQTTMATHGAKPPGIESGIALREYKDQTQRPLQHPGGGRSRRSCSRRSGSYSACARTSATRRRSRCGTRGSTHGKPALEGRRHGRREGADQGGVEPVATRRRGVNSS